MKKYQERRYIDKNGIEHFICDYYSNAKSMWMACRRAVGSNLKEDVEQWFGTENLIVEDGGSNGRWYVCWSD